MEGQEEPIVVQTRTRTCIPNWWSGGIAPMLMNSHHKLCDNYPQAILRGPPSGFYNCHGLVFASRRTCIHPDDIGRILEEDNYQDIDVQRVLPGDVVLYEKPNGDIEHSGIVISKPSLTIPWVVSKWGSGGEFVHPALSCPYNREITLLYRRVKS